jgi:hypothetical protein
MTACEKADGGQRINQPNKGVVKVGGGGGGNGDSDGSGNDGDKVGGKDNVGNSDDDDNDDGDDVDDVDNEMTTTMTMTPTTTTAAVAAQRQRQRRWGRRWTTLVAAKAAGNESVDGRMMACNDQSGCRTTTQQQTK